MASWEGPFTVLRRVNETNYELDLGTRVTTLHINLLREWHERPDQVRAVNLVLTEDAESDEYEGELPLWEELHQHIGDCQIGDQLSDIQKRELKDLLYEYRDRFSNTLGVPTLSNIESKSTVRLRLLVNFTPCLIV